jgi:TetR/AcrR family transcriptional regulator
MNNHATLKPASDRLRGRPADTGQESLKIRLLDEAERLFADQGFAATSVRAIADAAGVNPSLVHYYFGNKKALLLAVLDRTFEPLAAALAAMKERHEATPQKIISLMMKMAGDHPAFPRLFVREVMLSSGDLQAHFIQHYAPRLGGALPALLRQEQQQGRIRPEFDPAISALMLLSLSMFPFVAKTVAESVLGIRFDAAGLAKLEQQVGELLTGGMSV